MNERIRELAREAAGGLLTYDAEGEFRLSEKEVEKFAELIVRECAAIISGAVALREPASTYVSKILELNNER